MESPTNIACVVLASGFGRRFGSNKLIHEFSQGKTLLSKSLEPLLNVFRSVHVVVQPEASRRISRIHHRLVAVPNLNAEQGMSQAIVAGVSACSSADGWLIALGDMPLVKESSINAVLAQHQSGTIVQPVHAGTPGNPVLFGSTFRSDLLSLKGDLGGKPILQANRESIVRVEVEDKGILYDVDRRQDIEDLRSQSFS